jgi:hypothetical protein
MVIGRNQTKKYVSRGRAFYLLKEEQTVALQLSSGEVIELEKVPWDGSVKGTNGKYYNDYNCKFLVIVDDDIYSVYGDVEKYEGMELVVRGEVFTGPILKSRAITVGQKVCVKYYANTKDVFNIGVFNGRTEKTTSALGVDYEPVYESVINNQTWT